MTKDDLRKIAATLAITLGIGVVIGVIGAGADAGIKTFEPGTPILAADVNANFSALVEAVGTRQARVTDGCPPGSAIRVIDADGGVACQPVGDGHDVPFGADNVVAGPGIDVSASDGDVAVSLDTGFTDARYPQRSEVDTARAELEALVAAARAEAEALVDAAHAASEILVATARAELEALLADNADAHGRIDAASRKVVQRTNVVSAGVIGSSALFVECDEGYVATGGGVFVSGFVPRSEVAWLTSRPDAGIGENPRRWSGEVRWTSVPDVDRNVLMYAVCLRTM